MQAFVVPVVSNFDDPIEPFEFLHQILTQTVRVPELLSGAEILQIKQYKQRTCTTKLRTITW